MAKKQKPPQGVKVIALANQRGGTAKTTSAVNLGIGLANQGKKVLLVDDDPQGDLTTALGWTDADNLDVTLTTQMERVILDVPFDCHEGILHHNDNAQTSGKEWCRVEDLPDWLDGFIQRLDILLTEKLEQNLGWRKLKQSEQDILEKFPLFQGLLEGGLVKNEITISTEEQKAFEKLFSLQLHMDSYQELALYMIGQGELVKYYAILLMLHNQRIESLLAFFFTGRKIFDKIVSDK